MDEWTLSHIEACCQVNRLANIICITQSPWCILELVSSIYNLGMPSIIKEIQVNSRFFQIPLPVCLSICPSVCLSVCPYVLASFGFGWYLMDQSELSMQNVALFWLLNECTLYTVCTSNDKIQLYKDWITLWLYSCQMGPSEVCILQVSSITVPVSMCTS